LRENSKNDKILRMYDVVMDWIHLAYDRVQWLCCEYGHELLGFMKSEEFIK